jgi:hypothetical protein
MAGKRTIDAGTPESRRMVEGVRRAVRCTERLNALPYDDREGIAAAWSELTGQPVDPTLHLIPPVYSDCGLNLRIGRNVFVNQGCRLDDIGGIELGDDVMLGPGVRITDDDHRLGRDRTHLRVADVLVVDAQDLHLLEVGVERRRVGRVLLERLLDGRTGERRGAETRDALHHRRVPAVLAVGGGQRDQLVDERRMMERELQRDPTALRVAHHIRALDLQGAQQRGGIVAELLVRHLARRIRGAAVPLLVEDDHGALAREGEHPRPHRVGGHEPTRDEQQRRRLRPAEPAVHLVVEAQAVDRQVTRVRRLRRHHFGP